MTSLYVVYKIKKQREQNKSNKQEPPLIETDNRLVVTRREGGWERAKIDKCIVMDGTRLLVVSML